MSAKSKPESSSFCCPILAELQSIVNMMDWITDSHSQVITSGALWGLNFSQGLMHYLDKGISATFTGQAFSPYKVWIFYASVTKSYEIKDFAFPHNSDLSPRAKCLSSTSYHLEQNYALLHLQGAQMQLENSCIGTP